MSSEYPCIYFEKDGKCRKFSDDTVISYCVMGPCPEQKLSNADRIRDMSDEELALQFGANCPKENRRACDRVCSKCWLEWLRQPSEEGT